MLVFVVIGIVGLALALLTLTVGDFLDLGDGALSGTALGAGLMLFGASGAVVTANGLPVAASYPVAIVVGVLVVLGVQLLLRRLGASDDGEPVSLVGVQGIVTSDVAPGHGEVRLDAATELENRLAFSEEPIEQGMRIVVVEHHGSRVKVEPAR
ncbi:NfeD family protein [Antribacter gilvus]|uniref:NfeD family protein n=1 Tax=Antribacter gilvus TaxID=2304675 RepID=UPI000F7AEF56|nr:NfeD family protein [Antribacter gilvus]